MALFKILKGGSDRLGAPGNLTQHTKNGYAYFTPDTGKFYIDITEGETPIVASRATEGNRICINGQLDELLVLNCGTPSSLLDISSNTTKTTTYLMCGDASATSTSNAIEVDCGDATTNNYTTIYSGGNAWTK